ncbi:Transposase DDE domain-containing protein [Paenibacillus algorifonticola]|uniref:Transposase DDE domain-containing protein n=2 Tax=Paenibacillus algorifonticola TaxID=684063 RepID=A0A1I2J685_9BACL|nr:Transposase DDE domain-containing protein [Paenibacillus algorifonticola]
MGLSKVHYSCFSGKAADVPFAVFKELFHLLVRKCNRETRRKLAFPKELLLIDSTTVTVGKTRLPWAPYHGEHAAIKLHVALQDRNMQPLKVTATIGSKHDGPVGESLENNDFIMVMDRAYGKLERLDRYKKEGPSFVIRLRDNVHLEKPRALRRLFDGAKHALPRHAELSFFRFTRLLLLDGLPIEWMLRIHRMINDEYGHLSVTYSG